MTSEDLGKELETELTTFAEGLHGWKEHNGEYVLIKGTTVVGFFASYEAALTRGYEMFGLIPFLVKQVLMNPKAHFITRLAAPNFVSS